MAPVNILAVISPESDYYEETYEIFTKLCDKVLENERDCLSFLVFHGTNGEIIISKRYASMEAYQRHHKSDYVVAALNGYRKAAEPVIKTFDIASSYGFGSPEEKTSIGGSPTVKNVLPVASQTVDAMRT